MYHTTPPPLIVLINSLLPTLKYSRATTATTITKPKRQQQQQEAQHSHHRRTADLVFKQSFGFSVSNDFLIAKLCQLMSVVMPNRVEPNNRDWRVQRSQH